MLLGGFPKQLASFHSRYIPLASISSHWMHLVFQELSSCFSSHTLLLISLRL